MSTNMLKKQDYMNLFVSDCLVYALQKYNGSLSEDLEKSLAAWAFFHFQRIPLSSHDKNVDKLLEIPHINQEIMRRWSEVLHFLSPWVIPHLHSLVDSRLNSTFATDRTSLKYLMPIVQGLSKLRLEPLNHELGISIQSLVAKLFAFAAYSFTISSSSPIQEVWSTTFSNFLQQKYVAHLVDLVETTSFGEVASVLVPDSQARENLASGSNPVQESGSTLSLIMSNQNSINQNSLNQNSFIQNSANQPQASTSTINRRGNLSQSKALRNAMFDNLIQNFKTHRRLHIIRGDLREYNPAYDPKRITNQLTQSTYHKQLVMLGASPVVPLLPTSNIGDTCFSFVPESVSAVWQSALAMNVDLSIAEVLSVLFKKPSFMCPILVVTAFHAPRLLEMLSLTPVEKWRPTSTTVVLESVEKLVFNFVPYMIQRMSCSPSSFDVPKALSHLLIKLDQVIYNHYLHAKQLEHSSHSKDSTTNTDSSTGKTSETSPKSSPRDSVVSPPKSKIEIVNDNHDVDNKPRLKSFPKSKSKKESKFAKLDTVLRMVQLFIRILSKSPLACFTQPYKLWMVEECRIDFHNTLVEVSRGNPMIRKALLGSIFQAIIQVNEFLPLNTHQPDHTSNTNTNTNNTSSTPSKKNSSKRASLIVSDSDQKSDHSSVKSPSLESSILRSPTDSHTHPRSFFLQWFCDVTLCHKDMAFETSLLAKIELVALLCFCSSSSAVRSGGFNIIYHMRLCNTSFVTLNNIFERHAPRLVKRALLRLARNEPQLFAQNYRDFSIQQIWEMLKHDNILWQYFLPEACKEYSTEEMSLLAQAGLSAPPSNIDSLSILQQLLKYSHELGEHHAYLTKNTLILLFSLPSERQADFVKRVLMSPQFYLTLTSNQASSAIFAAESSSFTSLPYIIDYLSTNITPITTNPFLYASGLAILSELLDIHIDKFGEYVIPSNSKIQKSEKSGDNTKSISEQEQKIRRMQHVLEQVSAIMLNAIHLLPSILPHLSDSGTTYYMKQVSKTVAALAKVQAKMFDVENSSPRSPVLSLNFLWKTKEDKISICKFLQHDVVSHTTSILMSHSSQDKHGAQTVHSGPQSSPDKSQKSSSNSNLDSKKPSSSQTSSDHDIASSNSKMGKFDKSPSLPISDSPQSSKSKLGRRGGKKETSPLAIELLENISLQSFEESLESLCCQAHVAWECLAQIGMINELDLLSGFDIGSLIGGRESPSLTRASQSNPSLPRNSSAPTKSQPKKDIVEKEDLVQPEKLGPYSQLHVNMSQPRETVIPNYNSMFPIYYSQSPNISSDLMAILELDSIRYSILKWYLHYEKRDFQVAMDFFIKMSLQSWKYRNNFIFGLASQFIPLNETATSSSASSFMAADVRSHQEKSHRGSFSTNYPSNFLSNHTSNILSSNNTSHSHLLSLPRLNPHNLKSLSLSSCLIFPCLILADSDRYIRRIARDLLRSLVLHQDLALPENLQSESGANSSVSDIEGVALSTVTQIASLFAQEAAQVVTDLLEKIPIASTLDQVWLCKLAVVWGSHVVPLTSTILDSLYSATTGIEPRLESHIGKIWGSLVSPSRPSWREDLKSVVQYLLLVDSSRSTISKTLLAIYEVGDDHAIRILSILLGILETRCIRDTNSDTLATLDYRQAVEAFITIIDSSSERLKQVSPRLIVYSLINHQDTAFNNLLATLLERTSSIKEVPLNVRMEMANVAATIRTKGLSDGLKLQKTNDYTNMKTESQLQLWLSSESTSSPSGAMVDVSGLQSKLKPDSSAVSMNSSVVSSNSSVVSSQSVSPRKVERKSPRGRRNDSIFEPISGDSGDWTIPSFFKKISFWMSHLDERFPAKLLKICCEYISKCANKDLVGNVSNLSTTFCIYNSLLDDIQWPTKFEDVKQNITPLLILLTDLVTIIELEHTGEYIGKWKAIQQLSLDVKIQTQPPLSVEKQEKLKLFESRYLEVRDLLDNLASTCRSVFKAQLLTFSHSFWALVALLFSKDKNLFSQALFAISHVKIPSLVLIDNSKFSTIPHKFWKSKTSFDSLADVLITSSHRYDLRQNDAEVLALLFSLSTTQVKLITGDFTSRLRLCLSGFVCFYPWYQSLVGTHDFSSELTKQIIDNYMSFLSYLIKVTKEMAQNSNNQSKSKSSKKPKIPTVNPIKNNLSQHLAAFKSAFESFCANPIQTHLSQLTEILATIFLPTEGEYLVSLLSDRLRGRRDQAGCILTLARCFLQASNVKDFSFQFRKLIALAFELSLDPNYSISSELAVLVEIAPNLNYEQNAQPNTSAPEKKKQNEMGECISSQLLELVLDALEGEAKGLRTSNRTTSSEMLSEKKQPAIVEPRVPETAPTSLIVAVQPKQETEQSSVAIPASTTAPASTSDLESDSAKSKPVETEKIKPPTMRPSIPTLTLFSKPNLDDDAANELEVNNQLSRKRQKSFRKSITFRKAPLIANIDANWTNHDTEDENEAQNQFYSSKYHPLNETNNTDNSATQPNRFANGIPSSNASQKPKVIQPNIYFLISLQEITSMGSVLHTTILNEQSLLRLYNDHAPTPKSTVNNLSLSTLNDQKPFICSLIGNRSSVLSFLLNKGEISAEAKDALISSQESGIYAIVSMTSPSIYLLYLSVHSLDTRAIEPTYINFDLACHRILLELTSTHFIFFTEEEMSRLSGLDATGSPVEIIKEKPKLESPNYPRRVRASSKLIPAKQVMEKFNDKYGYTSDSVVAQSPKSRENVAIVSPIIPTNLKGGKRSREGSVGLRISKEYDEAPNKNYSSGIDVMNRSNQAETQPKMSVEIPIPSKDPNVSPTYSPGSTPTMTPSGSFAQDASGTKPLSIRLRPSNHTIRLPSLTPKVRFVFRSSLPFKSTISSPLLTSSTTSNAFLHMPEKVQQNTKQEMMKKAFGPDFPTDTSVASFIRNWLESGGRIKFFPDFVNDRVQMVTFFRAFCPELDTEMKKVEKEAKANIKLLKEHAEEQIYELVDYYLKSQLALEYTLVHQFAAPGAVGKFDPKLEAYMEMFKNELEASCPVKVLLDTRKIYYEALWMINRKERKKTAKGSAPFSKSMKAAYIERVLSSPKVYKREIGKVSDFAPVLQFVSENMSNNCLPIVSPEIQAHVQQTFVSVSKNAETMFSAQHADIFIKKVKEQILIDLSMQLFDLVVPKYNELIERKPEKPRQVDLEPPVELPPLVLTIYKFQPLDMQAYRSSKEKGGSSTKIKKSQKNSPQGSQSSIASSVASPASTKKSRTPKDQTNLPKVTRSPSSSSSSFKEPEPSNNPSTTTNESTIPPRLKHFKNSTLSSASNSSVNGNKKKRSMGSSSIINTQNYELSYVEERVDGPVRMIYSTHSLQFGEQDWSQTVTPTFAEIKSKPLPIACEDERLIDSFSTRDGRIYSFIYKKSTNKTVVYDCDVKDSKSNNLRKNEVISIDGQPTSISLSTKQRLIAMLIDNYIQVFSISDNLTSSDPLAPAATSVPPTWTLAFDLKQPTEGYKYDAVIFSGSFRLCTISSDSSGHKYLQIVFIEGVGTQRAFNLPMMVGQPGTPRLGSPTRQRFITNPNTSSSSLQYASSYSPPANNPLDAESQKSNAAIDAPLATPVPLSLTQGPLIPLPPCSNIMVTPNGRFLILIDDILSASVYDLDEHLRPPRQQNPLQAIGNGGDAGMSSRDPGSASRLKAPIATLPLSQSFPHFVLPSKVSLKSFGHHLCFVGLTDDQISALMILDLPGITTHSSTPRSNSTIPNLARINSQSPRLMSEEPQSTFSLFDHDASPSGAAFISTAQMRPQGGYLESILSCYVAFGTESQFHFAFSKQKQIHCIIDIGNMRVQETEAKDEVKPSPQHNLPESKVISNMACRQTFTNYLDWMIGYLIRVNRKLDKLKFNLMVSSQKALEALRAPLDLRLTSKSIPSDPAPLGEWISALISSIPLHLANSIQGRLVPCLQPPAKPQTLTKPNRPTMNPTQPSRPSNYKTMPHKQKQINLTHRENGASEDTDDLQTGTSSFALENEPNGIMDKSESSGSRNQRSRQPSENEVYSPFGAYQSVLNEWDGPIKVTSILGVSQRTFTFNYAFGATVHNHEQYKEPGIFMSIRKETIGSLSADQNSLPNSPTAPKSPTNGPNNDTEQKEKQSQESADNIQPETAIQPEDNSVVCLHVLFDIVLPFDSIQNQSSTSPMVPRSNSNKIEASPAPKKPVATTHDVDSKMLALFATCVSNLTLYHTSAYSSDYLGSILSLLESVRPFGDVLRSACELKAVEFNKSPRIAYDSNRFSLFNGRMYILLGEVYSSIQANNAANDFKTHIRNLRKKSKKHREAETTATDSPSKSAKKSKDFTSSLFGPQMPCLLLFSDYNSKAYSSSLQSIIANLSCMDPSGTNGRNFSKHLANVFSCINTCGIAAESTPKRNRRIKSQPSLKSPIQSRSADSRALNTITSSNDEPIESVTAEPEISVNQANVTENQTIEESSTEVKDDTNREIDSTNTVDEAEDTEYQMNFDLAPPQAGNSDESSDADASTEPDIIDTLLKQLNYAVQYGESSLQTPLAVHGEDGSLIKTIPDSAVEIGGSILSDLNFDLKSAKSRDHVTYLLKDVAQVPKGELHEELSGLYDYLLRRRFSRVSTWLEHNLSHITSPNEQVEAKINQIMDRLQELDMEYQALWRLCESQCATCSLKCCQIASTTHEHDCLSDHLCDHLCEICSQDPQSKQTCAYTYGHGNDVKHQCNQPHYCGITCSLKPFNLRGCEFKCKHLPGHATVGAQGLSHHCLADHFCNQYCSACGKYCMNLFNVPHKQHTCGETKCKHTCQIGASCSRPCNLGHHHTEKHSCGFKH